MQLKPLTEGLMVGPQVQPGEVADLARQGFRSLIGNRPDDEAKDQPAWSEIAAAAGQQGMAVRHIPVVAPKISDSDVEAFRKALEELPRPIAAFCRTGTRAAMLWALANPDGLAVDERIAIAARNGFDLEAIRPRLEQRAGSAT